MRVFAAIEFDDDILDIIEAALDDFAIKRPPWRWTKRSTWHVTLKFIGEVEPGEVETIAAVLSGVAARHAPFQVTLGPFGGFPNLGRPRVLFYDAVEGVEPMAALAEDINRVLATEAGIRAETKPFRAHATVARVKTRIGKPAADALRDVPDLVGASQQVTGFTLMQSERRPKGSVYTKLKEFALA